jgi:hypothetical protein
VIPTEKAFASAVEAFEWTMDAEGYDNEPKMAAFYGKTRDDNGDTDVKAMTVPSFNKVIEVWTLGRALANLARFFGDPANSAHARTMVDAVPGYGFLGLAVGYEGLDTDDGDDIRAVVGIDTAGRVMLTARKGNQPAEPVGLLTPAAAAQIGCGEPVTHLRDLMVPLCAAMPEGESDIVAVSRVVQTPGT